MIASKRGVSFTLKVGRRETGSGYQRPASRTKRQTLFNRLKSKVQRKSASMNNLSDKMQNLFVHKMGSSPIILSLQ